MNTYAEINKTNYAPKAANKFFGNNSFIQPKLTINNPNDAYEQEADAVADKVMRMEKPSIQTMPINISSLQRKCAHCEEEEKKMQRKEINGEETTANSSLENYVGGLSGNGQPLPNEVRSYYEPRFGYDFSNVKVHTDSVAAKSAQSINALAYTSGNNIVFNNDQYSPNTNSGKRLLGHELTHVVQQGSGMKNISRKPILVEEKFNENAASGVVNVIQRAGDPAAIPPGLRCPTDLIPGRPAGTDVLFSVGGSAITPAHTAILTTFRDAWVAAGGSDNILVHGYASTDGDQGTNWILSCDRAESVQAELIRLGIPAVRISLVAHGESTDFGTSNAPNRHAVVSSSSPGIIPLPVATGVLTARDNFAGRSTTRFGVGETVDLSFVSIPPRPAIDFGGLEWRLVSGGGVLTPGLIPNNGAATYTAPATASTVQLDLRVATGATAGRVISTHTITIVIPSAVNITRIGVTPVAAGLWGNGFTGNVFVDPKDVSFQGVVFGEGTVASVISGSFLAPFAAAHPVNTFGPGHAGNATTGTPVSPPPDGIFSGTRGPVTTVLGVPVCGSSDFLWAIPWEFSVAGGPRTPFAGGFTANHHQTSNIGCQARIEKGGAGPFCRNIDGTIC
jgi:outer membrane protein OmpA-like peptidoglycan-associated protein